MWNYEKRLEYPVNITNPNPEMAKLIISQFGGPDRGRLYRQALSGGMSVWDCSFRAAVL